MIGYSTTLATLLGEHSTAIETVKVPDLKALINIVWKDLNNIRMVAQPPLIEQPVQWLRARPIRLLAIFSSSI
jgi:hypothetical protein